MDSYKFQKACKEFLIEYYKEKFDISLGLEDVYVVWACKTLQNNKILMITNVFDGRYCEFTRNGDKQETYFDIYVKEENRALDI